GAEYCNSSQQCQQAFCPINTTTCYGRTTAKCCNLGFECDNSDLDNPACAFSGSVCARDQCLCGSGNTASSCESDTQICDSSSGTPTCRLVLCVAPKIPCVNNDRTAATCCGAGELCNRTGDTPTCEGRVINP